MNWFKHSTTNVSQYKCARVKETLEKAKCQTASEQFMKLCFIYVLKCNIAIKKRKFGTIAYVEMCIENNNMWKADQTTLC